MTRKLHAFFGLLAAAAALTGCTTRAQRDYYSARDAYLACAHSRSDCTAERAVMDAEASVLAATANHTDARVQTLVVTGR